MKTINKNIFSAIVFTATFFVSSANAGGFVGDIIEGACGGCGAGQALDRANAQMGQPFDHGVAAVANAYVPGAGAVIEGGYAIQRNGPQCFLALVPQFNQFNQFIGNAQVTQCN